MSYLVTWNRIVPESVWELSADNYTALSVNVNTTNFDHIYASDWVRWKKVYFEFVIDNSSGTNGISVGISRHTNGSTYPVGYESGEIGYINIGEFRAEGGAARTVPSFTTGDIIGVAADLWSGKFWFSKNGVWLTTGANPSTGANPDFINYNRTWYAPVAACVTNSQATIRVLSTQYTYTIPSGFIDYQTAVEEIAADFPIQLDTATASPGLYFTNITTSLRHIVDDSVFRGVRGNTPMTSGRHAWSAHSYNGDSSVCFGMIKEGEPIDTPLGSTANSIGWYPHVQELRQNGVVLLKGTVISAGDPVFFGLDLDTGTLQICFENHQISSIGQTGITGTWYPAAQSEINAVQFSFYSTSFPNGISTYYAGNPPIGYLGYGNTGELWGAAEHVVQLPKGVGYHTPSLIDLSRYCPGILNDLGANKYKIAAFDYQSYEQMYIEIVEWDVAKNLAVVYLRENEVNSDYIFFAWDNSFADNTKFVGVAGSVPASMVWPTSSAYIYHLGFQNTTFQNTIVGTSGVLHNDSGQVSTHKVEIGAGTNFFNYKAYLELDGNLDSETLHVRLLIATSYAVYSGTHWFLSKGAGATQDFAFGVVDGNLILKVSGVVTASIALDASVVDARTPNVYSFSLNADGTNAIAFYDETFVNGTTTARTLNTDKICVGIEDASDHSYWSFLQIQSIYISNDTALMLPGIHNAYLDKVFSDIQVSAYNTYSIGLLPKWDSYMLSAHSLVDIAEHFPTLFAEIGEDYSQLLRMFKRLASSNNPLYNIEIINWDTTNNIGLIGVYYYPTANSGGLQHDPVSKKEIPYYILGTSDSMAASYIWGKTAELICHFSEDFDERGAFIDSSANSNGFYLSVDPATCLWEMDGKKKAFVADGVDDSLTAHCDLPLAFSEAFTVVIKVKVISITAANNTLLVFGGGDNNDISITVDGTGNTWRFGTLAHNIVASDVPFVLGEYHTIVLRVSNGDIDFSVNGVQSSSTLSAVPLSFTNYIECFVFTDHAENDYSHMAISEFFLFSEYKNDYHVDGLRLFTEETNTLVVSSLYSENPTLHDIPLYAKNCRGNTLDNDTHAFFINVKQVVPALIADLGDEKFKFGARYHSGNYDYQCFIVIFEWDAGTGEALIAVYIPARLASSVDDTLTLYWDVTSPTQNNSLIREYKGTTPYPHAYDDLVYFLNEYPSIPGETLISVGTPSANIVPFGAHKGTHFNGVDQYMYRDTFAVDLSTFFRVSMFVEFGTVTSGLDIVLSIGDVGTGNNVIFGIDPITNYPIMGLANNYISATDLQLERNKAYLLTWTYDNGVMHVYVDGNKSEIEHTFTMPIYGTTHYEVGGYAGNRADVIVKFVTCRRRVYQLETPSIAQDAACASGDLCYNDRPLPAAGLYLEVDTAPTTNILEDNVKLVTKYTTGFVDRLGHELDIIAELNSDNAWGFDLGSSIIVGVIQLFVVSAGAAGSTTYSGSSGFDIYSSPDNATWTLENGGSEPPAIIIGTNHYQINFEVTTHSEARYWKVVAHGGFEFIGSGTNSVTGIKYVEGTPAVFEPCESLYTKTLRVNNRKVSSSLTDFPIKINLDRFCQELIAVLINPLKLAVTTMDCTVQCPVEIECWEVGHHVIHTKLPFITSGAVTEFQIMWDDSQPENIDWVGNTGSLPAQNVWDDNYMVVYHMAQDPSGTAPQILDSTSNNFNGTSQGSMTDSDLTYGYLGKALRFDGSDDGIVVNGIDLSEMETELTVDVFQKVRGIGASRATCVHFGPDTAGGVAFSRANGDVVWNVGIIGDEESGTVPIELNIFKHYAQRISASGSCSIWTNGVYDSNVNTVSVAALDNTNLMIGKRHTGVANPIYSDIEEVRLSKIARSFSWIQTTNATLNDELLLVGTISGIVTLDGSPISRKLYLYEQNTGEFLEEVYSSDIDGSYNFPIATEGEYFVVCFDDAAGDDYKALILDRLVFT